MNREEILEKLIQHAPRLAQQYQFRELYLFGSVARGDIDESSDVDLLVEFSEPIGLFDFLALKNQFEELLSCRVDLGTKRSLKREIQDIIEAEAIRVS